LKRGYALGTIPGARSRAEEGRPLRCVANVSRATVVTIALLLASSWSAAASDLRELRPLAERGDRVAQFEIGVLYAYGRGVPADPDQAVHWYRRSAEQGYPPAQYRLGLHYYGGVGVPQDRLEALFWIGLARLAGMPDAIRWIDEVDTRLTDEEEAELRRRLSSWKPRPQAPPASASGKAKDVDAIASPYFVQLGSLRSDEAARSEWARLHAANRDLLGDLALSVDRADLGRSRGVFFRVRAGPVPARAEAEALCLDLATRSVPCLVIPPPDAPHPQP
jgi:hypothetical protein